MMHETSQPSDTRAKTFDVRVLRQDRPEAPSYWQTFRLDYEPGMNMTSVLQRIAAEPRTIHRERVAPIAYDANCLEEVCGACTMLINGRVRQACSALVDRLLSDRDQPIELRPLTKFRVIRDLVVDRRRLFRALEKVQGWVPVDGYYDMGPGPRQSPQDQERAYPLSQCMSCGCCLEACPQYLRLDLAQDADESDAQFRRREDATFDRHFLGAHAKNQAVLTNMHPTGRATADRRIEALIAEGGIQNCGKAANCQAVCPHGNPLMTSWARAGRAATLYTLRRLFGD